MRYVDRYTAFNNLDVKPEVAAILRASVYNQQLFGEPDDDPTYTTQSIKYAEKDKPRADYRPISEISGSYDVDYEEILQLLGFEGTALEFQLESWAKLNSLEARARDSGRDQGLVITAPTGFGKTACFFGFVMNRLLSNLGGKVGADVNSLGDAAIFVYPSRALLHDQLTRVMNLFYDVKEDGEEIPKFGIWYGNQPQNSQSVKDTSKSTAARRGNKTVFTGAKYWGDEANDQTIFIKDEGNAAYTLENNSGEELFDSREFYIGRREIVDRQPNLILTTLESLENIAMKPHYDLVNIADYFVFDEIHQYSGLRGSHAANVIQNIKRVRNSEATGATSPALFVGSSATIQNPGRFGRRLFGLAADDAVPNSTSHEYTENDLEVVSPNDSDIDKENEDKQHYYFMLTPEEDDGPDVASQFLQHAMMVGHSLLEEEEHSEDNDKDSSRSNILSFIDSKSLLRNLDTKFVDADQRNQLYQYHFGHGYDGDWRELAHDTGHVAQDSAPLNDPLPVYSGSRHSIDEIPSHDLTLGTKYLEVGVDIESLRYIINYREPESVAALKQRAGRAARKEGDAHMFNLLSSYSGDTNFYYRSDGFVDQDISTPLRTNNHVVDTIHNWFHQYYTVLSGVDNWKENESVVVEQFFNQMGWDEYNKFLQSPQVIFNNLLDLSVYTSSLLDESLNQAFRPLKDKINEIDEYFEQFQEAIEQDAGEVFLQRNAITDLLEQFQRKLAKEINTFLELSKQEGNDDLTADLEALKSDILNVAVSDPEEAAKALNEQVNDSFGLLGEVRKLPQTTLDGGSIDNKYIELSNKISDAVGGIVDGKIQQKNRQRRIGYYLRKSLEEVSEYKSIRFQHGSLYAVKYLFRGAYYFEKALRVNRETETDSEPAVMGNIWYVPPNYFADTGWYFDLVEPSGDENKESIDKLLTQYLPFRTEYAAGESEIGDASAMNVFQPEVIRTEDGELEFNFSELGEVHNGVLVPDRIELKRVMDSSHRGNKIVPYDGSTYEILSPNEVELSQYEEREYGQIYASPQVSTRVNDPTETSNQLDKSSDLLELRSINAQAWIEAVNLEVTQTKEIGGRIYPDYDLPTIERTISSGDQRVGYSLNTRGVTLSIDSLMDRFRNDAGQIDLTLNNIPQHKDLNEIENEEVVSYTTAHLLTMLVADVTGVNTQVLLYGTDRPADSTATDNYAVHTFEQIEGGQGVVDLFWDTMESRPEEVLSSLYRLTRNEQVLNEKLWAMGLDSADPAWKHLYNDVDVDELKSDDDDVRKKAEDTAAEVITEYLGYTYDQTIHRVLNELRVTLDHIDQLSQEYEISSHDLAELKADIAAARVVNEDSNNGETLPPRILQDYSNIFDKIDREVIRAVFLSPDFDGCEANLHLNRTIFNHPQSAMLSNGVLDVVEDWLVDRVPVEDELDEMNARSKLSAYTDDDYAYFLKI